MKHSFLPKRNACSFNSVGSIRGPRRQRCCVVANRDAEEAKDWRVKQMVTLCRTYFRKLWSKGDLGVASEILDSNFVHQDNVWRRKKLIVGPEAFSAWVGEMKKAYPDFYVEPVDFGTSGVDHLFVQFEGRGTNLGRLRGKNPTRHHSTISGVSTFHFNEDRSKIISVNIWRTPLAEDQIGGVDPTDLFAIHLNRLHFD